MLSLAIDAAHATGGLVTAAVGAALVASGYDRDFAELPLDGDAVASVPRPSFALPPAGRTDAPAHEPVALDLNGVVKSKTVDDALALARRRLRRSGRRCRDNVPVDVGLPGGDSIRLYGGGLATRSVAMRRWRRGGELATPPHRPGHRADRRGHPGATSPWPPDCVAADIAAKAALLLGQAGPSWLDRRGLAGRFVDEHGAVHLRDVVALRA